jgi:hypothetical protein
MTFDSKRASDATRRIQFGRMTLPVSNGQCVQPEALGTCDRSGRERIQPPAQQDDAVHLRYLIRDLRFMDDLRCAISELFVIPSN